jgi:hypothetical protein
MTPQQIREVIKTRFPDYYDTESHRRNVAQGHYSDVDHALLAQIYGVSRTSGQVVVDKTLKPIRLVLSLGQVGHVSNGVGKDNVVRRTEQTTQREAIMSEPLTPTCDLLSDYLAKWKQLENYRLQEASLGLLFQNLCPENKEIEHVLLKVSALNDFYSTNIFDTYSVARHILTKDIDDRLKTDDYSLVNDIAQISIKNKNKNFYSFASKYCSHHKPTSYPIYDSFVEKMLLHYKSRDNFDSFDKVDLKNYGRLIKVIRNFQGFYKLDKFTLREIDIFLWLAGKDWFPKKYR